MTFKVPPLDANLPIADPDTGSPTPSFQRWWLISIGTLVDAVNGVVAAQAAAALAQTAANTAQTAANSAQTAANTAQTSATTANTAATAASAAAAANAKENALINSYISPNSVLTATPTVITIASHTRYYADGTSVAVTGGTATATASGDVDYVSYSDPTRAGGSVSYVVSTVAPTQGNNIHVVGAVTIPASGSHPGGAGPQRPGYVLP